MTLPGLLNRTTTNCWTDERTPRTSYPPILFHRQMVFSIVQQRFCRIKRTPRRSHPPTLSHGHMVLPIGRHRLVETKRTPRSSNCVRRRYLHLKTSRFTSCVPKNTGTSQAGSPREMANLEKCLKVQRSIDVAEVDKRKSHVACALKVHKPIGYKLWNPARTRCP